MLTSKTMRENPLFMRNEFEARGKYGFSLVKKQELPSLAPTLIACSDTRSNDNNINKKNGVHFFVDDFRFSGIYDHPERSLSRYAQYAFLLTVIPTISWGNTRSFEFCFDGVEQNAPVAIGMVGCKRNKIGFLRGYNAMMEKLNPSTILCFGAPFSEMEGNIISVDYRSSRKVVR